MLNKDSFNDYQGDHNAIQIKAVPARSAISAKLSDYAAFTKARLAALVVFSSGIGYLIGSAGVIDWHKLGWLLLGGFFVTSASDGFNQIIERDRDKLMTRTFNRPIPQGRMSLTEAYIIAFLLGITGILLLWGFMNPLCGMLSGISLLTYVFGYTPLKPHSSWAVFVGAFPGAMSPMLGYIAAGDGHSIGIFAWLLFAIQFMWQFPHFWAIAWVADDDYRKAGFRLLPSGGGRTKRSAFLVLIYTFSLLPLGLLPWILGQTGAISAAVIFCCSLAFLYQAYKLYMDCSVKSARQLMFGSFFYLPVVQLALLFGK